MDTNTKKFSAQILPVHLRLGEVITLSAMPKHGATTIALSVAHELEELNPLYLSTQIPFRELVELWVEKGHEFPSVIGPKILGADLDTDSIEDICKDVVNNYGTRIIIVDNLLGINDFGRDNKYAQEVHPHRITLVMKHLRKIAQENNVIMFVVVPISVPQRRRIVPSIEDLRYSAGILENADITLLASRTGEITSNSDELKFEISVGASRSRLYSDIAISKYNSKTGFIDFIRAEKFETKKIDPDIWERKYCL